MFRDARRAALQHMFNMFANKLRELGIPVTQSEPVDDSHPLSSDKHSMTRSRIDTTVHRMVRAAISHCKPAGQGSLSWHARTLRHAAGWVELMPGGYSSGWFPRQCATKWGEVL